jgi:uncharacterized protein
VNQYFFDSSALVKRYYAEDGSSTVDQLISAIAAGSAKGIASLLALPEVVSTINRKKNQGFISARPFSAILVKIYEEMALFRIIPVAEGSIVASIAFILKHNLNSADALHLVAALSVPNTPRNKTVFVSCDKRLLIAARKEKLRVLNPETGVMDDD